jgi:hypothetical protein
MMDINIIIVYLYNVYMDRSLLTKSIRRPNRLGRLFTRRHWNTLRDAVKNKMYKDLFVLNDANIDEINNVKYIPTENTREPIKIGTDEENRKNIFLTMKIRKLPPISFEYDSEIKITSELYKKNKMYKI